MNNEDETALLLKLFDIVYAVQPQSFEWDRTEAEKFIKEQGKQVTTLVDDIIENALAEYRQRLHFALCKVYTACHIDGFGNEIDFANYTENKLREIEDEQTRNTK